MQDRIERRQFRIGEQASVKIPVERGQLEFVAGFGRALHRLGQHPQVRHKRLAPARDRTADAPPLDGAANAEQLDRLDLRTGGDDGAAMALPHDRPLVLQLQQRLADGALAAGEPPRQFQLRQRLARPEIPSMISRLSALNTA